MRTIGLVSGAALVALLAAGCATLRVGSYTARDVDLARYRTYDWAPADALPTGDARLDNNTLFHDRFQGAVEQQLAARGLTLAQDGVPPDLLVHYHATAGWRAEVETLDRSLGYCTVNDCTPQVRTFEAGTFVLDVIETRSKRLVWRGWAEDRFEGAFDTQERLERTVDRAVKELLKRFPARS